MILKIALVLLYLVIGLWLFFTALSSLGGKQAYKDSVKDDFIYSHFEAFYIFAIMYVTLLWPLLALKGIMNYRRERRGE